MEDWDEEYESDRHYSGRPSYPRASRSSYHRVYLDRDPYDIRGGGDGADLRRARSSGHGPMPSIHIHNRNNNDMDNVDDNRGRLGVGGYIPGAFPAGRSRSRSAANAEEIEYQRRKWRQEQKAEEDEARKRADRAVEEHRNEERERSRERERILQQAKLDDEKSANDRKELIRQAIRDEEAKKRKEADDRKELLRQARQDEEDAKAKEKKEREEMILRIKVEEEEQKAKDKAAWEEHERKKLEKEKKEKDEQDKKDKEYMERVTKDFARYGFTESQIQRAIKHEEEKKAGILVVNEQGGRLRSRSNLGHRPVYPKIHRQDVAVETLKTFALDWEYDRANKDYIIILHELTEEQTDQLFEHTKQLQLRSSTKLLDDGRGRKDNDYVWIKKRGTSRGKSRDRSHHGGFRERFAENLVRRL